MPNKVCPKIYKVFNAYTEVLYRFAIPKMVLINNSQYLH